MMQKQLGARLDAANAPFRFAPEEGPCFFEPFGWRVTEARSMFSEATRLKRVPFWMRMFADLPESKGRQGRRPWSGVCLLSKPHSSSRKSRPRHA